MIATLTRRIAGRTKSLSLGRYRHVALVLLLDVVLTAFFFNIVQNQQQARAQAEFERQASTYVAAIQKGIERNLEVLESIGGLFAASAVVERQDFRAFVKGPLSRHQEIQALSWNQRVKDSDRASYEAAIQNDGFPNFQITERNAQGQMETAERRAEYISVTYIEPLKGNETALGFDVASNPTHLKALERSRETGEMVATARITLVQETGEQFGLLILKPVYKSGAPHETVEQRRQILTGFAVGVFRIGDMVEAALRDLPEVTVNLRIDDETAPAGERALYLHQSRTSDGPANEEQLKARGELYVRESLEIPGRQWSLLITPTSEFFGGQPPWEAWGILAAGLLITALLVAYLISIINHAHRTQRLADQLKASEEQFRDLYMNAPVSYFAVGKDGLIKRCNKAAEELIGHLAKDLVGKPVFDIYADSPQGKEKASTIFQRFVSGQGGRGEELEMLRADGTRVWVSLMVDIVRGPRGEIKESRSVAVDITERKQAEAERVLRMRLDAENRELLRVNETRSEFLSTVSHELKAPLTSILGFTDILARNRDGNLTSRQIGHLKVMRRSGDRLNTLIDDLLDVSRVDAGTLKLECSQFPVRELFNEIVETFAAMITERGQSLDTALPDEALWIEADRQRLAQVVTNLLSNASKYSSEGAHIELKTWREDDRLLLTVADNGIGISEEDQTRLFTPFFRADNDSTRSVAGTGLGLAITKSIVELHGGQIEVESELGARTTFRFQIPGIRSGPSQEPGDGPARSHTRGPAA